MNPVITLSLAALTLALSSHSVKAGHTARITVADGFITPVGNPPGSGYYVFRGYAPNGHQGEDWNGNGGGNTDLGDAVNATADGVVVFSEDYFRGWGNVVILRHAYRDAAGTIQVVDSLYGHLDQRSVRMYQNVKKGQQVGTIGTAHGKYYAHLHFEMRKNLSIGMQRSSYAQDFSNYFSPRIFIASHRTLKGGDSTQVSVDTFAGQGGSLPDDPPPKKSDLVRRDVPKKMEIVRRDAPIRDPKQLARTEEAGRRVRADELQKLAEENQKKVAALTDEDMDSFWSRLKTKLGKKK